MYLVAVGWMYVVVLMTVAEATGTDASLLGAFFTFFLYGVLPLAIVMYLLRAPARRRARRALEAEAHAGTGSDPSRLDPDRGDHAPGHPVAAERKKP